MSASVLPGFRSSRRPRQFERSKPGRFSPSPAVRSVAVTLPGGCASRGDRDAAGHDAWDLELDERSDWRPRRDVRRALPPPDAECGGLLKPEEAPPLDRQPQPRRVRNTAHQHRGCGMFNSANLSGEPGEAQRQLSPRSGDGGTSRLPGPGLFELTLLASKRPQRRE